MVTVCPICSTELNDLAKGIPYAHHSKSFVENNPVVLPNDRVYGRERLTASSAKIGVEPGSIKDPITVSQYDVSRPREDIEKGWLTRDSVRVLLEDLHYFDLPAHVELLRQVLPLCLAGVPHKATVLRAES